jgi:hypothetical protein
MHWLESMVGALAAVGFGAVAVLSLPNRSLLGQVHSVLTWLAVIGTIVWWTTQPGSVYAAVVFALAISYGAATTLPEPTGERAHVTPAQPPPEEVGAGPGRDKPAKR